MTVRYENYTITPVHDARTGDDKGYCNYAVTAHNGITITDSGGWELPDCKVLFTTEACAQDGGRAECRAFIEGYQAALPFRPVMFVNSALE